MPYRPSHQLMQSLGHTGLMSDRRRGHAATLALCIVNPSHYCDVIMGPMASQITSLTFVYSIVYSGTDQRKHQSSASLAFVRGIHPRPVNSPHKWPVTRKMFPFDDVIMANILGPSSEFVWHRRLWSPSMNLRSDPVYQITTHNIEILVTCLTNFYFGVWDQFGK